MMYKCTYDNYSMIDVSQEGEVINEKMRHSVCIKVRYVLLPHTREELCATGREGMMCLSRLGEIER